MIEDIRKPLRRAMPFIALPSRLGRRLLSFCLSSKELFHPFPSTTYIFYGYTYDI